MSNEPITFDTLLKSLHGPQGALGLEGRTPIHVQEEKPTEDVQKGDLWYKPSTEEVKVYTGKKWKELLERGIIGLEGLSGKDGKDGKSITGSDGKKGAKGDKGDAASFAELKGIANSTLTTHTEKFDHTLIDPFLVGSKKLDETGMSEGMFLRLKGDKLIYSEIRDVAQRQISGGGGLPQQSGNSGKFLKTLDGKAIWSDAGGGDALVANPLSQFAATTSLQLKNTISDETGSGALVFATSPTLVTPLLGTPTSCVATNFTGTAAGLTAGNVTTNANLTGVVTSAGNATAIADAALSIAKTSGLQAALDAKQGTLTNSAGLLAALSDETGSGFAVFGTAPNITSPTGIVKGDVGLGNVDNTSNATERAATATLTNKRVTLRIGTEASSATSTPTADSVDQWNITALAVANALEAPTGTPTDGQKLIIRIKDNGTARALTWNAIYRAMGTALPSTTVISKTLYLGFIYNVADIRWDMVAAAQEA